MSLTAGVMFWLWFMSTFVAGGGGRLAGRGRGRWELGGEWSADPAEDLRGACQWEIWTRWRRKAYIKTLQELVSGDMSGEGGMGEPGEHEAVGASVHTAS